MWIQNWFHVQYGLISHPILHNCYHDHIGGDLWFPHSSIINPRCACAARVTVYLIYLSVCLCVCLYNPPPQFSRLGTWCPTLLCATVLFVSVYVLGWRMGGGGWLLVFFLFYSLWLVCYKYTTRMIPTDSELRKPENWNPRNYCIWVKTSDMHNRTGPTSTWSTCSVYIPWKHKKAQQRACIDSRTLSTIV